MKKQARKSDSIKNEPNSGLPSSKNAKKQIRGKSRKGMFVGIDLHKKFLQVAVMNDKGKILRNDKVENSHPAIKQYFKKIPKRANIVMESSSVWYGVYRLLTETLRYSNVMLSNPYTTKAIAASKKKTDKIDAKILADLSRGGYIAGCYVPDRETVELRQLVRLRQKIVQWRT